MSTASGWESVAPEPAQGPERAGGRLVAILVLGLLVLVGGGYVAAYYAAGDKVPRGTTIAGVSLGGQTPDEAVQTLESQLGVLAQAQIQVRAEDKTGSLDPENAGLSVDYASSVAAAGGGRSWRPSRLWDYYTGGDSLEAQVEVETGALDAALTELDATIATPPRDGAVTVAEGRVETTAPRAGRSLDPAASRGLVLDAYLDPDAGQLDLPVVDTAPEIDQDDVRAAVDFANPALSAPITLVFKSSPITLRPQEYAGVLSFEAKDGALEPTVDAEALTALVEDATSGAGAPVDATVRIAGGRPEVVPSKPGVAFEPADVVTTFLDLVTRPEGQRRADVAATVDKADFTTKDARQLQITEEVSSFSTFFPFAEYRNVNIGRAAELVDGTVLKPGEVFSMNDTVGERTRQNGFTEGFIISDGVFKQDLGGGVSQLATTLFNGMFFAGLEDVEHKPHSLYIDRYPVGREATIAFGFLDLRFKNDTKYGVLVDAEVTDATPGSQGEVKVTMYSTKVWDITTDESDRYQPTSPGTRTLTTPDCEPNTGYGGFTIDVFRYFRRPGESELVKQQKFTTVYKPADTVICEPPPDE